MLENMSDWFVSKLIKYKLIKQENYSDVEYYIRLTIFIILSTLPMIIFGYFFNTLQELIVVAVIFNITRNYTMNNFHASTLEKCCFISIPYISLICIISKFTLDYSEIFFMFSIIFGLYMTKYVSIGNINKYLLSFFIFIISSLIFDNIGYNNFANAFNIGILSVYILLNKYTIKFFQWLDSKL